MIELLIRFILGRSAYHRQASEVQGTLWKAEEARRRAMKVRVDTIVGRGPS